MISISRLLVLGISMVLMSGCDSFSRSMSQQSESRFIEEFCETDNIVPVNSQIKLLIDLKQEELLGYKGEIDSGIYRSLSQELSGYSTEWEILNKRDQQACKIRALCLYRERISGECENSETNYRAAQERADNFMLELRKFSVD